MWVVYKHVKATMSVLGEGIVGGVPTCCEDGDCFNDGVEGEGFAPNAQRLPEVC